MKLLLRDYLAALREREELDAILPDLISERGWNVFSRPQRGTQQRGVDIAAVGVDDDGQRKVFLFSVKAGDLTRQDWDGTPQALRPSLNEILDVYVENRLPARFRHLKVVICLAFGGSVQEQVREPLESFIRRNSSDRISFDEWNGDRIADLLLKGLLREELLPKPMRSSFQKAVAMLDEPDVAYGHFAALARALREAGGASNRARIRSLRQLNLATWVVFVWARDAGNLEAAYRISELALLFVWELAKPLLDGSGRDARSVDRAVRQVIELHLSVASELLEGKVFPHAATRHGISSAIDCRDALDVNLALFELLGRVATCALWLLWLSGFAVEGGQEAVKTKLVEYVSGGLALVANNPALLLPVTDRQATDVALFLVAWMHSGLDAGGVTSWLEEMANRLEFTVRTRTRYPIVSSDYGDLANHPVNRSDEYFEEVTTGSTLVPLLQVWLHALQRPGSDEHLATLAREALEHCTMQLWMPDAGSEKTLYVGEGEAGRALTDLPVDRGGEEVLRIIRLATADDDGLEGLTAMQCGNWPIVLTACRHHRLPVPPGFWIDALLPPDIAGVGAEAPPPAN